MVDLVEEARGMQLVLMKVQTCFPTKFAGTIAHCGTEEQEQANMMFESSSSPATGRVCEIRGPVSKSAGVI